MDKPTITIEPSLLIEGMNVILKCLLDAFPTVSYQWFFNGLLLNDSKAWLSLQNVSRGNTGKYLCQTQNSYMKKKSDNVSVNINCKFIFPMITHA